MASSAVDLGTGMAITFSTGFFAQILSVSWGAITRPAIKTSHMGTTLTGGKEFGSDTFIPGDLVDPGELTVELHLNPDTTPPVHGAAETVTVTFAEGATWACSGFMTSFEWGSPLEDKMTATATIKFSGGADIIAG